LEKGGIGAKSQGVGRKKTSKKVRKSKKQRGKVGLPTGEIGKNEIGPRHQRSKGRAKNR